MRAFDDSPAIPDWLGLTALASMIAALANIFLWVPPEATMGNVQRIFYFHVPAAFVAFTASFVGGIAAILYLTKHDPKYDDLSLAANESVVVFQAVNILMGMMWARPVWGIWWTWDARLTSSFLQVCIYVAYLVLRRASPVESRAPICAVISILGMADVPLIYMSNRLFRTQHPSPVMGGGQGSGLAPEMWITWGAGTLAMFLLWGCILKVRRRVARLDRAVEDLTRRTHELVEERM
jgi:heme exporter protein C